MAKIHQEKKALEKQLREISNRINHLELVIEGDKPDADQAKRIKSQAFSFAVCFERRKTLRKVRSPGAFCKSLRRFTTTKEATHHAKRFAKIHRHKKFVVTKVSMRANAWINWLTGKTNPVLG